MAYFVRRPGNRWEIRESYSTEKGPRSRTLVTFKTLSPQIVARATRKSHVRFDSQAILMAAKRAGVPWELPPADELATALVRKLAQGAAIRPGLRRLLLEILGADAGMSDHSLTQWIGASDRERADALVDLLDLADRLPKPRRTTLKFPGSSASRLRHR